MEVWIIETEDLIDYVYRLDRSYKIPVIEESAYERVKIKKKMALATVIMNGNENPELIEGFLKIADYFKALIIKKDDRFFVTADSILFILEF